jgi:Na+/proline symporter
MKVLTPADVSAGLPASAAASALLGQSGAAALLVLLFLAVTSASSAEMIAVSSILTYDVYVVRLSSCLLVVQQYLKQMLAFIEIHQP